MHPHRRASRGRAPPPARRPTPATCGPCRTSSCTSWPRGSPHPGRCSSPLPFGVGLATVEGRLFEPPPADPADRAPAAPSPQGLADFVRLAAPLARHADLAGRGPLGPPRRRARSSRSPAGTPFDFAATAGGAEWIEELGGRARACSTPRPPRCRWSATSGGGSRTSPSADGRRRRRLRLDAGGDGPRSRGHRLGRAPVHHRRPLATAHVPTPDEIREFVADYEAARGDAPQPGAGRVAAKAAYVFCTAYGARYEHVLAVTRSARPGPLPGAAAVERRRAPRLRATSGRCAAAPTRLGCIGVRRRLTQGDLAPWH